MLEKNQLNESGFSVLEMAVVTGMISILATVFLLNFRENSTSTSARHQISSVIIADLRRAQSLALAGATWSGQIVCGFGVHYLDKDRYLIYAGAAESSSCSAANRNYQSGTDFVVETRQVNHSRLEISGSVAGSFYDIFFEAPDPKVYLNGNASLTVSPTSTEIYVVKRDESCLPANCTTVSVYTSGRINLTN